jgi:hypothetical protein
MPRPASHTFAFEPEHIQAMDEAFDAVCVKLQLSMGSEDRMTELVGEKIICLLRLRNAVQLIDEKLSLQRKRLPD